MFKYEAHQRIENDTPLANIFNEAMKAILVLRMVSAPDVRQYAEQNESRIKELAYSFYQFCMVEVYFHNVINVLLYWQKLAEKYNDEFKGNWRYYALSQRVDSINEFGSEDDNDYNKDGSINNEVSNDILSDYSIVYEMTNERSAFLDTRACMPHMMYFYSMLYAKSEFNVFEILEQASGKRIPSYRMDKNGNRVQNTRTDEQIMKVEDYWRNCSLLDALYSGVVACQALVMDVLDLDQQNDNKEFFKILPKRIQDILNLNVIRIDVSTIFHNANNHE